MSKPVALTRAGLAQAVRETVTVSNSEAADLVDNILKLMCQALSRHEEVKIMNFGSFCVRRKPSRLGRNPKTGVEVEITPRAVLTFKASGQFRDRVCENPQT